VVISDSGSNFSGWAPDRSESLGDAAIISASLSTVRAVKRGQIGLSNGRIRDQVNKKKLLITVVAGVNSCAD
jgi:hypothetical protein